MVLIMKELFLRQWVTLPGSSIADKKGKYLWIPPFDRGAGFHNRHLESCNDYRIKGAVISDSKINIELSIEASVMPSCDTTGDNSLLRSIASGYKPGKVGAKLSLPLGIRRKWFRSRPVTVVKVNGRVDKTAHITIPAADGEVKASYADNWRYARAIAREIDSLESGTYVNNMLPPISRKEFKRIVKKILEFYPDNTKLATELADLLVDEARRTSQYIVLSIQQNAGGDYPLGLAEYLLDEDIIKRYPTYVDDKDYLEIAAARVRIVNTYLVNIGNKQSIDQFIAAAAKYEMEVDKEQLVAEIQSHVNSLYGDYALKDNYKNCYVPLCIVNIAYISKEKVEAKLHEMMGDIDEYELKIYKE